MICCICPLNALANVATSSPKDLCPEALGIAHLFLLHTAVWHPVLSISLIRWAAALMCAGCFSWSFPIFLRGPDPPMPHPQEIKPGLLRDNITRPYFLGEGGTGVIPLDPHVSWEDPSMVTKNWVFRGGRVQQELRQFIEPWTIQKLNHEIRVHCNGLFINKSFGSLPNTLTAEKNNHDKGS